MVSVQLSPCSHKYFDLFLFDRGVFLYRKNGVEWETDGEEGFFSMRAFIFRVYLLDSYVQNVLRNVEIIIGPSLNYF